MGYRNSGQMVGAPVIDRGGNKPPYQVLPITDYEYVQCSRQLRVNIASEVFI